MDRLQTFAAIETIGSDIVDIFWNCDVGQAQAIPEYAPIEIG